MSLLNIKKIGITKLKVDCIVNAANSGIWEGGGVCGAIFREAGSHELQAACNAIGGCEVGSAVITPAFQLMAKYIIHAVGPQWTGGKDGKKEQLYSCYQASMKLAQDNECHTIAFPLISAGIFGYPKEEAWQVAVDVVRDYQASHTDYTLDVTFAVLADDMLELGTQTLEKEKKPKEHTCFFHYACFHRPEEENGYMSNWHMRDFSLDGKTYCCVEQYMMERKALIF